MMVNIIELNNLVKTTITINICMDVVINHKKYKKCMGWV